MKFSGVFEKAKEQNNPAKRQRSRRLPARRA